MENFIVIVVLALIVGAAVAYLVKAKKSGVKCIGCPSGGNCPSSQKIQKKKLDGPIIGKKTLKISGMQCEHCVMNVTQVLNRLDGVRAEVKLSTGSAIVSYDREIDTELLKDTVEKIGYKVISIS